MHPHESLIRTHVEGEGSERERQEVDEHLKECSDCREFLAFMQDFSETARGLADDEIAADEPHARKSVIIAYEEGRLDAETSAHLRAHMLFCDQCAEAYYLLKRMRAPSWTEVVIEAIRSAKEFLLKPIEITGMGELMPVPATVTRGAGEELEAGQSRIEIAQHVMDSGEEADILLCLEPEDLATRTNVRLLIGIDPPKPAWRVNLLDAQQKQIASVPLAQNRQLLHSSLAPGAFVVQVASNEDILAECRLKIQASHEQASPHRDR
jgi:hypothetical protein